ncbi:unnamed protein product [Coffea canephora]|uniref:DH200=94 genomic scaffold, scaffold_371 n=1 Tax=Coffea canephora TaxID=49390 RepID=A0A068VF44_COFCA|nr:unnamed protein product [Coffea canephora]
MYVRSKARTLAGPVNDPAKLPMWNYDWSSTDLLIRFFFFFNLVPKYSPQAIFNDPFRRGNNIFVRAFLSIICDAYSPAGEPILTNEKQNAAKIFSSSEAYLAVLKHGIEQEYTLLQKEVKWPIGWPVGGYPGPQGPYYCRAGADKAYHDIVDSHYKASLYAGMESSKSTPCCRRKLNGLLDGQSEGILDRRCCAFVSFDVH